MVIASPSPPVYVHVPFCTRKCPYCAFVCTDDYGVGDVARFLAAVESEAAAVSLNGRLRPPTLYFGGGTPSALPVADLDRWLGRLAEIFDLSACVEITFEANPAHVDRALAEVLVRRGVTRVSLGAQSFDDRVLRRLGRDHTTADVLEAFARLRESGLRDVNVDVMYGVPRQDLAAFVDDLRRAAALGATHVSLYGLEIEPSTPYGEAARRGEILAADSDLSAEMFAASDEVLNGAGLHRYEVSNFAIPGFESKHNGAYWRNEEYVGIGPGAYGRRGTTRTRNFEDLNVWADRVASHGDGVGERIELGAEDDYVESLASGLRTREGVDRDVLLRRTGIDVFARHGDRLHALTRDGFAVVEGPRVRLTMKGLAVLDAVMLGFLERT
ncbi:MAG TPA: radical SAM family heme chaperone HemW [Planctomycetota bacterium]|nr:radical SAM family heme chaperone HemW [Planctomycetota bacterium]